MQQPSLPASLAQTLVRQGMCLSRVECLSSGGAVPIVDTKTIPMLRNVMTSHLAICFPSVSHVTSSVTGRSPSRFCRTSTEPSLHVGCSSNCREPNETNSTASRWTPRLRGPRQVAQGRTSKLMLSISIAEDEGEKNFLKLLENNVLKVF